MWLRNNKNREVYKEMKRGIFLLALSGCLLLAGCQKETEVEKGQADVSENVPVAATDEIGNIEALDIEALDIEQEKDMTVISVLGKEELAIETERIYGAESELGCLDNRFTPEEIDIILNAIEGTWIVDEYVDFVPYENSIWSEEEGTEEEKQKKYDDDREQAEENLPDFSFQVKGYNDQEPAASSHYIYVYNNKWYASPMSVVLNMQEKDGYPVIYIDFFSISYSEAEKISYEPASLVLAADGSFLLLKDGAFYSLKNSIQGMITSGDFSCLTNDNWEGMQKSYISGARNDFFEWRQMDLNGDGIEDLILQEKDTIQDTNIHRIHGIFACQKDGARCILWDEIDNSEYHFCGATGELMYCASNYGGAVSQEPYFHKYFDEEWNMIADYTLVVYYIDSAINEASAKIWRQEHPDMAEDGIYYRKYTEDGVEVLTREELESIYEMCTGYDFYSDFY